MTEVPSQRALNRATLARPYLLDRVAAPAVDAIEHLAGCSPRRRAPHVGLWDFAPGELSALT